MTQRRSSKLSLQGFTNVMLEPVKKLSNQKTKKNNNHHSQVFEIPQITIEAPQESDDLKPSSLVTSEVNATVFHTSSSSALPFIVTTTTPTITTTTTTTTTIPNVQTSHHDDLRIPNITCATEVQISLSEPPSQEELSSTKELSIQIPQVSISFDGGNDVERPSSSDAISILQESHHREETDKKATIVEIAAPIKDESKCENFENKHDDDDLTEVALQDIVNKQQPSQLPQQSTSVISSKNPLEQTSPTTHPPILPFSSNNFLQVQNSLAPSSAKLKAMSRSVLWEVDKGQEKRTSVREIHTSCGTIELSLWKICSFFGLCIAIFLIVSLVVGVSITFVFRITERDTQISLTSSNLKVLMSSMHLTTLQIVFNGFTMDKYKQFIETKSQVNHLLSEMIMFIQQQYSTREFTRSYELEKYRDAAVLDITKCMTLQQDIVSLSYLGNIELATDRLYMFENSTASANATQSLDELATRSMLVFDAQEKISSVSSSINLAICILCLFIIIPVLILAFVLSINREVIHRKRWKKANAIVLLDTMADEQLAQLFKEHCKKEMALENFLFLQEVSMYKDLCLKAIEIQETLFNSTAHNNNNTNNNGHNNTLDELDRTDSGSGGSGGASSPKRGIYRNSGSKSCKSVYNLKQAEKVLTSNLFQNNKVLKRFGWLSEKDMDAIEQRKYEKAKEIYQKFLDISGEYSINTNRHNIQQVKETLRSYESQLIDFLPDTLFDNLEREIAELLVDAHRRFKKTLAFQKQMKIEKYVEIKKRTRRNTTISDQ
ncbi:hypothetical protein FDP41_008520 [Naegleria fowleri]|uniref:RGS domain-containing protein n=1 Tax=Naegleria fowleri TaxID=5763 RepID=A0A6A5B2F5_NAEFO|nr:uncharacterized protein FDP41_008520 [Naegleria fowleri]KAF0973313.1 hypothetical protein FDP41_008520 [Naegleria fowleri]